MCGRIFVRNSDVASKLVSHFGINFSIEDNLDLRPTQQLLAIQKNALGFHASLCPWGIKPSWSKSLIINARIETVSTKPTFKKAFAQNPVQVPISGWYEWREEAGSKQKFRFESFDNEPLLMQAFIFPEMNNALVSLTTEADELCNPYHGRMPVVTDFAGAQPRLTVSPC